MCVIGKNNLSTNGFIWGLFIELIAPFVPAVLWKLIETSS